MQNLKTIAIYESDWNEIQNMMKHGQTFRQKIHELILKEKLKGGNENVQKKEKERNNHS